MNHMQKQVLNTVLSLSTYHLIVEKNLSEPKTFIFPLQSPNALTFKNVLLNIQFTVFSTREYGKQSGAIHRVFPGNKRE